MLSFLLTMNLLAAEASPMVEIIAHRGASHDAPENTVAAFELAWKQGADAAELDLYMSKDGKIVVLHDKDTKRVAGVDKKIADMTFDEIRKLDVGRWKGEKFAGAKIPTLEEMLMTAPPGKRVFIEVKPGPEIVAELLRILQKVGRKPEQTPIIAFDKNVIAAVKKARPDLPAYWLVSLNGKNPPTAESMIATAKAIGADGLDLSASPSLDKAMAVKIHAAGLKLYVWTVNDADIARRMIGLGVLGITTDRPAWLRERLK